MYGRRYAGPYIHQVVPVIQRRYDPCRKRITERVDSSKSVQRGDHGRHLIGFECAITIGIDGPGQVVNAIPSANHGFPEVVS